MPIKVLAGLLLIAQIATIGFIVSVLRKQLRLFKLHIDPEIKNFRKTLFLLALAIFLGNIIPMTIGFLTLVGAVRRSATTVNLVSGAYTVSNTLTLFFSAMLIWVMYRLAKKTATLVEHDKDVALQLKNK